MKPKSSNINKLHNAKPWQRVVTAVAAFTILVSAVPTTGLKAVAEEMRKNDAELNFDFPQDLIDELQKYCGTELDAETMLTELYRQGIINEEGDFISDGIYDIDGKKYTEDQLRQEAMFHTREEEVVAEGELMTWGEISDLLIYKDCLEAFQALKQGYEDGTIDPDDPNREALEQDLLNELGSRMIFKDGQFLIADSAPESYPLIDENYKFSIDSDNNLIAAEAENTIRINGFDDGNYDIIKDENNSCTGTKSFELESSSDNNIVFWEFQSIDMPFNDEYGIAFDSSDAKVVCSSGETTSGYFILKKGTNRINLTANVPSEEYFDKVSFDSSLILSVPYGKLSGLTEKYCKYISDFKTNAPNKAYDESLKKYISNYDGLEYEIVKTSLKHEEIEDNGSQSVQLILKGFTNGKDVIKQVENYLPYDAMWSIPTSYDDSAVTSYLNTAVESVSIADNTAVYGENKKVPVVVKMNDGYSLKRSELDTAGLVGLVYHTVNPDGSITYYSSFTGTDEILKIEVPSDTENPDEYIKNRIDYSCYGVENSLQSKAYEKCSESGEGNLSPRANAELFDVGPTGKIIFDADIYTERNSIYTERNFEYDSDGKEYATFYIPNFSSDNELVIDGLKIVDRTLSCLHLARMYRNHMAGLNPSNINDTLLKRLHYFIEYSDHDYLTQEAIDDSMALFDYQFNHDIVNVNLSAIPEKTTTTIGRVIDKDNVAIDESESGIRKLKVKIPLKDMDSDALNSLLRFVDRKNEVEKDVYCISNLIVDDRFAKNDKSVYIHRNGETFDYLFFWMTPDFNPVPLKGTAYVYEVYDEYTLQNVSPLPTEPVAKLDYTIPALVSYYNDGLHEGWGERYHINSSLGNVYYNNKEKSETVIGVLMNRGYNRDIAYMLVNKAYGFVAGQDMQNSEGKWTYNDYDYAGDNEVYGSQKKRYQYPLSAELNFAQPYFVYSDEWKDGMGTDGTVNGVPIQYWTNETIDNWSSEKREERKANNSEFGIYLPEYLTEHYSYNEGKLDEMFPMKPNKELDSYKACADAGAAFDTCSGDEVYSTTGFEYNKLINENGGIYPLTIENRLPVECKYNNTKLKDVYGISTIDIQSGTNFNNPMLFRWVAEYTDIEGNKSIIYPDSDYAPVTFSVIQNADGTSKVVVKKISLNDEGSVRFILQVARSLKAVEKIDNYIIKDSHYVSGEYNADFTFDGLEEGVDYVSITSSAIKFSISASPYLLVPSASKKVYTSGEQPTDIVFSSNLAKRNKSEFDADETEFVMNVYECGSDGKKTTDVPVYTTSIRSTYSDIVSKFRIPEKTLTKYSAEDEPVYYVEISASLDGEISGVKDFSDTAYIIMKHKPVSFVVNTDTAYFVNNNDISVNYNVSNAEKTFDGYYEVTRKSDNTVIAGGDIPESAVSGTMHTINIDKSLLSIDSSAIKDVFSVTFYGRNNPDEKYSTGVTLLNVYKADAIEITIDGNVIENGKEYVISNKKTVEDILVKDEKHLDISDSSLSVLQKMLSLKGKVKLNNSEKFGALSDSIEWSYKYSEQKSSLYYSILGAAQQIESFVGLIPDTELIVSGTNGASGTIKAVHSNTGLSSEVNVRFEDVNDKLYLFQFIPAIETTLEYKDKNGELKKINSDEKGQLALYEENGILKDSNLKAYSESEDIIYMSNFDASVLKTGAGDEVKKEFYPINSIRLHEGYALEITIPEAKNKDVVLRGGAYKYTGSELYNHLDTYCDKADILLSANQTDDDPEKSNGIKGIKIHTDEDGRFKVYFEANQIFGYNNDTANIGAAFEVSADGFVPQTFEVNNIGNQSKFSKFSTATVNLEEKDKDTDFNVISQKLYYPSSEKFINLTDQTVGYTQSSPTVYLYVMSTITDSEKYISRNSDGYAVLDENTDLDVYYINRDTKKKLGGDSELQENISYVYQFSTVVNNSLKLTCNKENMDNVAETGYFVQAGLAFTDNNGVTVYKDVKYNILNSDEIENPVSTEDINDVKDKIQDKVSDPSNFFTFFNNDDGWTGIIFTGAINVITGFLDDKFVGKNSPFMGAQFNCTFVPTSDPTEFEVLFGFGADDSLVTEEAVDAGATAAARAQALTHTASTSEDEEGTEEVGTFLKEGLEIDGEDWYKNCDKKEISKAFNKQFKKDNNNNEEDEDEDADKKLGFILYGIVRAKYNPDATDEDDRWTFSFKGMTVGAKAQVSKDFFKGNTLIGGFIPITYSISGNVNLDFSVGVKNQHVKFRSEVKDGIGKYYNGEDDFTMGLLRINTKFGIELYAGVGFDYEAIALSVGAFANGEIGIDIISLFYDGNEDGDIGSYGAKVSGSLEIGLKVKAKLLFISYERTLVSASIDGSHTDVGYADAQNLWSGFGKIQSDTKLYNSRNDDLELLSITKGEDGKINFTLDSISEKTPKLLSSFRTNDNIFANGEANSKLEEVKYSDDGSVIVYLDDNIASYADRNGISKGAVIVSSEANLGAGEGIKEQTDEVIISDITDEEKAETDNNPEQEAEGETIRNYGDYSIDICGSGSNVFAAWSQQRNETSKDKNYSASVSLEDLAIAMNSTEIIAAVYDSVNDKWIPKKITNNYQADISPKIVSAGEKAVIVWESSSNSDSDSPLASNVSDKLMYSVYENGDWSEAAALYDGSIGKVGNYNAAMLSNGSVAVAYTVDIDENNSEVFYTLICGEVSAPTRVTLNSVNETEVKAAAVGDRFVIAWYDDAESDIKLLAVNGDGTIDNKFPESVARSGYSAEITNVFDIAGGDSANDFAVVWAARENTVDKDGNAAVQCSVYGAKLFEHNGIMGITPPQSIDSESGQISPDEISVISDENDIRIIIKETSYDNVKNKSVSAEIAARAVINPADYESDEEYQKALNDKTEELKSCNNSDYINFLVSDEVSSVKQLAYTFKESVSIENAAYDEEAVIPNIDAVLMLSVSNDGITPVDSIKLDVNNETQEISLDEALLPGNSIDIPYNYDTTDGINDLALSVSANGAESNAKLLIDSPRPLIESCETTKAVKGIRTFTLRIVNELSIPFAKTDKHLVINVYSDEENENLIKSVSVDDEKILERIDNGVGDIDVDIDVRELMDSLEIEGTEIPEEGIKVYFEAVVVTDDGEVLESSSKSAFVKSLLDNRTNPLSIESIMNIENDKIKVSTVIFNNSLEDQYLCNVNVKLLDENGNVIAEKNSSNEAGEYETISAEDSVNDEKYDIIFEGIDADKISRIETNAYNDKLTVTFDMGCADDIANEEVCAGFAGKLDMPERPESEVGEFEGWYLDRECTERFDFDSKLLSDTTLYANWTLPNINAGADGCFTAPDGSPLVYDAKTRTLKMQDGTDPTVNEGRITVDAGKLYLNGNENADSSWFDIKWYDSSHNECTPVNAGEYTAEICGTGEGTEVSGKLIIHVTIAPYVLKFKEGTVTADERQYDGTTDFVVNCENAEINLPTDSGFFHDDEVVIEKTNVVGKADKVFGNVNVAFSPEMSGKDAGNYTFGDNCSIPSEIVRREAEIEWGRTVNGEFIEGTDDICLDENGKAEITARVANAVNNDRVYIECENNTTASPYTDITAKAVKISGENAEYYSVGANSEHIWRAVSDKIVLSTASITLCGNIGINFYTYIPDEVLADTKAYALISSPSSTEKLMLSELENEGDGKYKLTHEIAAKEIADDISIEFHNCKNAVVPVTFTSGSAVNGNCFRYSVSRYIDAVKNNNSGAYSEALTELVSALSDYGSFAQMQFNYNTDNVNETSNAIDAVNESMLSKYAPKQAGVLPEGLTLENATLVLESETTVRVYFGLEEGYSIDSYVFKADNQVVTPVEKDGYYYVEFTDIPASELDKYITFDLNNGEFKMNYCALSYADTVLRNYENDENYTELCNTVKALYLYNQAAVKYFRQK